MSRHASGSHPSGPQAVSKEDIPQAARTVPSVGAPAEAGGSVHHLRGFPDRSLPVDANQAGRTVHLPRDRQHRAALPKTIGGVSATIEYAVGVLGVPDVIVCGHTDCGVMKGVLNPEALEPLANVSAWLRHARPARGRCGENQREIDGPGIFTRPNGTQCRRAAQKSATHPSVAARLEQGLKLHGWVYHLAEGTVTTYDSGQDAFFPIRTTLK